MKRNIHPNTGYYQVHIAFSQATARRRRFRKGPHFSKEYWELVAKLLTQEQKTEQKYSQSEKAILYLFSFIPSNA